MAEGNDEKKEKTIKEELQEQKTIITIEIDQMGNLMYRVNKDQVPLTFMRMQLNRLIEQMIVEETLFIVDQHYMKKFGLSHKKGKIIQ